MRGGSVSAAAMALAVSAVVWHFAAPHWTIKQMRAAAEAGDAAAFEAYVDFPALRDSLAAEAGIAVAASTVTRADGGAGRLGREGSPFDRAIVGVLSPDGLRGLFAGAAEPRRGASPPVRDEAVGFAIDRGGFSTFRVTSGDLPGAMALVFRRDGYAWRLAAVDLAPEAARATR
jgi:hypothetical protein